MNWELIKHKLCRLIATTAILLADAMNIMRRLVYLLVLFVMFITTARAEIFYSTLKIGEQTTLNAYASPSSNHYVSKYEWWFPSVCVTATGGGSRYDSYCTILATGATKYVAGGI